MVSVIVPIFNAEIYLRRCLESIMRQSYSELEIILINDGSTDTSKQICEEFKALDSRIKLLSIKNGGVSNARNLGLQIASGEYITFVDADDYLDLDYIENYVTAANETKADIVIGGVQEEHDTTIVYHLNKNKIFQGSEIRLLVCALLDNQTDEEQSFTAQALGYVYSKLYRREIVDKLLFEKEIPVREDAIFIARALLAANNIAVRDFLGYHYMIHNESATGHYRKNFTEEVKAFLLVVRKIWKENMLPMDSFYIGCLYMYMRWLKMFAMNEGAGFSNRKQLVWVRQSFYDRIWNEGFRNAPIKKLKVHYRVLKMLFKNKCAVGIWILCRVSEQGRKK